jgi:hypothetical protein
VPNLWATKSRDKARLLRFWRHFTALQPVRRTIPPVTVTRLEEAMSSTVSPQHPAVVLRSHYVHVRTLLAIAMIAVVALAVTVVVLAARDDNAPAATSTSTAAPADTLSVGTTRYDGGPEEGTRGPGAFGAAPGVRYDGGPEEGTVGPGH